MSSRPASPAPVSAGGSSSAPSLPSTPVVLVTGKGGVGRSSTATAISVALAQRGARVALVHPIDAAPVLPPAWAPESLKVVGLDRSRSLANYLGDQLPGPFAAALRASRAFNLITAATPGLAELVTIGELRRMVDDPYDHIVFDAPATGHLLALLDAPGRFERAAAVGPIAGRARQLGEWISDPSVMSTVCVTTGDSLAVSEVLDLIETLEGRLGHGPHLVVANRLAPPSPPGAELERLAGRSDQAASVAVIEALATRARSERSQLGRVTRHVGTAPLRVVEMPGHGVTAILTELAAGDAALAGHPVAERRAVDRRFGDRRSGPGDRR